MQRKLDDFSQHEFDLLVVGAGAFGASAAWEAALRGLSVALIDAGDFGYATSANCYKVIHGGIRYLQHADVPRLRASARERSVYFRIAPHLTAPMPVAVPTYGRGKQGKLFLRTGLHVYDALTADRNRMVEAPERHVPKHRVLSRGETLAAFPGLDASGLTGAAVFHDGQMYSPERLTLAFVKSAAKRGAVVANYLRATHLRRQGRRVCGVEAVDEISGESLFIAAKSVLNTAGPWAERWLQHQGIAVDKPSTFSRDAYFVVNRPWSSTMALALQARTHDPDAVLARGARHLFCMPWRQQTIIGVWHRVWDGAPDSVHVPEAHLQAFVDEVNAAMPSLALAVDDVAYWNAGLVLFGDAQTSDEHLSYGKRSRFIDHGAHHATPGLFTLIGVRYTTARAEGVAAIDAIQTHLGHRPSASRSHVEKLVGADRLSLSESRQALERRWPSAAAATARALLYNYGDEVDAVLDLERAAAEPTLLPASHVLESELRFACRQEMATRLDDLLMRRTEVCTAYQPHRQTLDRAVTIAAEELGWDRRRQREERERLTATLTHKGFRPSTAESALSV